MNAKSHPQPRSLEQVPGSLQEEIWSQFRAVLKEELKVMIEQALEEELTEHLAARSHERTAKLEIHGHQPRVGYAVARELDHGASQGVAAAVERGDIGRKRRRNGHH